MNLLPLMTKESSTQPRGPFGSSHWVVTDPNTAQTQELFNLFTKQEEMKSTAHQLHTSGCQCPLAYLFAPCTPSVNQICQVWGDDDFHLLSLSKNDKGR